MENLSRLTDDQLVALYVEGQNEAFDVLLARYKSQLFSYIYYGVRDEDTANDVFQDTWMKAILTIRSNGYKGQGIFYSWLQRIARNLIIDNYRTTQTENNIPDFELCHSLYENAHSEKDCNEMEREAADSMSSFRGLIDQLPESQKEIVKLRIYENRSFKDIAKMKGMSINTALGRMHYAVNNMKRMASEQHFVPTVL